MTTLLLTHEDCLAHDPGRHHPESPARLQAVLDGLAGPEFAALERRLAPKAARADLRAGAFAGLRRWHSRRDPGPGPCRARRRHHRVARLGQGGAARGGRRVRRGRCGDRGRGGERLLRRAPARPSCRARARHGLLPLQQCRGRRPPRARVAWARARRRHRFRRPSRQRHAGDLRGRSRSLLRLDPSVPALSRHRRARASAASATSSTRRSAPTPARASSAPR